MSDSTPTDTLRYSSPRLSGIHDPIDIASLRNRTSTAGHVGLAIHDVSGLPLLFDGALPSVAVPQQPLTFALKRVIDIILSLCALIALGPLLLAIAAMIKATSPGPVFFRQEREGLNGTIFRIYKFRTMYLDRCDLSGVAQTRRDDDRVTPLGRLLRKKSLDELPQLINILRGEMSVIGPRPHVRGMLAGGRRYDELVPYYPMRHCVKPGLSGWAQVHGLRGPSEDATLARMRIEHDLAYAANLSISLDLKIIWLTLWREVIRGDAD